jgi:ABC-type oligopeptide transport system ATPase subunit
MTQAFLDVRDLRVQFPTEDGLVNAVDGVDFSVEKGKTLAIVGESGSGKSVTSQAIMGLINRKTAKMTGEVYLEGEELVGARPEQVRSLRGKRMAMIFQPRPCWCTRRSPSPRPTDRPGTCSPGSASPTRSAGSRTTRTTCPAACASA